MAMRNDSQSKKGSMAYIKMQQTQQILPCVKHKLPEPNSILPSEFILSEAPRHIRRRLHQSGGMSSFDWPLDKNPTNNKQLLQQILSSYYGPEFNLTHLLTKTNKIVFLNSLVHPSQPNSPSYYFASITTSQPPPCQPSPKHQLPHPRTSTSHAYTNQQTYELEFDDKIESGNLYFALRHQPGVYLLANRFDYNTRSYGQWFYFRVKNVLHVGKVFRFCIVNMTKGDTMFGRGLKISVCRGGVWTKEGCQIQYIQNKFVRKADSKKNSQSPAQTYFTLTFTLHMQPHQQIQISYNQPYTYSKLGTLLDSLQPAQPPTFSRTILCRTPLGNRIQVLTVSRKCTTKQQKRIIFITARAHPIETAGSYVMEGILNQLLRPALGENWMVERLLEKYIVKIVPMVNPDGVILGNSRCNLYGYDLNRQWKDPSKDTAPEIMSLKKVILKYQGKIDMFIDLHGHSTKKNVFAYGCHDFKNPFASREFPYILSKFSEKDFIFNQCRFSVLQDTKVNKKDGTARISLWRKLKIPNIFTIENSYCCAEGSDFHYDSRSYAKIGRDIVMSLCSYFNKDNPEARNQLYEEYQNIQILKKNQVFNRQNWLTELRNNSDMINLNLMDAQSVSSDSQPEDRIQIKPKPYIAKTPTKLNRNLSNKLYMSVKTQKMIKDNENSKKFEATTRMKKNTTLESNKTKEDQIGESPSAMEKKLRKRYLRNLSPLGKEKYADQPLYCLVKESEPPTQNLKRKRGDSQPQLHRHKHENISLRQPNIVTIVDIGLEGNMDYQRGNLFQMNKAISTKSINTQYGSRLNTLSSNRQFGSNNIIKYLKNMNQSQGQQFTDYHQLRNPILKVKKTQNTNKLKQFINKINTIQNNYMNRSQSMKKPIQRENSIMDTPKLKANAPNISHQNGGKIKGKG